MVFYKMNKPICDVAEHNVCVQQPIDFPVYAAKCMLTLGSKVSTVGSR